MSEDLRAVAEGLAGPFDDHCAVRSDHHGGPHCNCIRVNRVSGILARLQEDKEAKARLRKLNDLCGATCDRLKAKIIFLEGQVEYEQQRNHNNVTMLNERVASLKTALEEILGRHKRYDLTSVCVGCQGWTKWPCDATRLAKAMMGMVEAFQSVPHNGWCPQQRETNGKCNCYLGPYVNAALAHVAQELGAK